MDKNSATKFNANVMKQAIRHQQKLQREVGTNWWYERSKTSGILTVLSEIGYYVTLVVNLIVISGYAMLLEMNSQSQNWAMERAQLKNAMSSFVAGTLLVLAGYILKKISRRMRKRGGYDQNLILLISMIGFILGCVLLFITAYNVLVIANVDSMYAEAVEASTPFQIYVKLICFHALPLLMMLVPSILFYVMSRCDFKEKREIYERMTESLYKDFTKDNPNYSMEQWEERLNSYEGFDSHTQKENDDE